MDYSLPGSSVLGILQGRILEWVAVPFSRGSPRPRDQTQVSCIAGRFFTIWATREAPRSYMLWVNWTLEPQPENPWVAMTILCATSKTWCSQVKKIKYFLKKIPFHSTQKERTLQTPCSQTSSLQNSETVHFCCLSLQSVVLCHSPQEMSANPSSLPTVLLLSLWVLWPWCIIRACRDTWQGLNT